MTAPRPDIGFFDRLSPLIFDLGAPLVFFPVGGIDAIRERTLDALDVSPGASVLELGCGTGALTVKLLQRGARVTAVDLSEAMLRRARRRARSATFIRGDILDFKGGQKFDRVLLAFVLHHLEARERVAALRLAGDSLTPSGLLGILDWSLPPRGPLRSALQAFVSLAEPSSATDWLEQCPETVLEQSGLTALRSFGLARGTVRVVVAAPSGLATPPLPRG